MTVDSQEYRRFLASAVFAEREFRTIEIHHTDFSETLRFVRDYEDQTLTLEPTAPRNPSTAVLFTALSMNIKEPGETQDVDQVLKVDLGAIGNEVQDQIDQITTSETFTPIEVIYRKYYSGDISEPVLIIQLSASVLQFQGYSSVAFTAEDVDFSNARSGELYTLERFPTLQGI